MKLIIVAAISCFALFARAQTSVIDAVHKGHAVGHEQDGIEAVRAALASGGNVNERDKAGWTPLMHAALECRAEELKLLLDKGADPNVRSDATATGEFTESGQTAMLLGAGCFINRKRAQLAPERHMPADYASYELAAPAKIVRDLIRHHAAIDVADISGRTPLMMAAMHGWPEVIRELLHAHANIEARDRDGHTVLDFVDPGEPEIARILKTSGAPQSSRRSARVVCDAQRAIDKLSNTIGITDCISGVQFARTVKKFQQEHGLKTSGELDGPTLDALGIRR